MSRSHATIFRNVLDWHRRNADGSPGACTIETRATAVRRPTVLVGRPEYTVTVTAETSGRDIATGAFIIRGATDGTRRFFYYALPAGRWSIPVEPVTFPTLRAAMQDAQARLAVIVRGQHHDTCDADCDEGPRYSPARRY